MRPEVQSKGRSRFTGPVGAVWERGARGLSYRPRRRPGRRGPAPALHPPRGSAPAPPVPPVPPAPPAAPWAGL